GIRVFHVTGVQTCALPILTNQDLSLGRPIWLLLPRVRSCQISLVRSLARVGCSTAWNSPTLSNTTTGSLLEARVAVTALRSSVSSSTQGREDRPARAPATAVRRAAPEPGEVAEIAPSGARPPM